jgi:hypothetical protein
MSSSAYKGVVEEQIKQHGDEGVRNELVERTARL